MDSFDLNRVASQNFMGLTANYRGHPALIVGWDGKNYTLETETGRRVKTSDFIWHYETLADEDVSLKNAVIAAWRSDDSPYRDLKVRLAYQEESGEWDAWEPTSGIHLADIIAEESDPDFGGDDEARIRAKEEAEYEQALADAGYFIEEWNKLGDSISDDILLDPMIMLLPDMIEAASDPKIDGFANPEIKKFFDTEGESCGCHKGSKRLEKTAFLPAVGPILGAAAGLARSLGPGMMAGQAVRGLTDVITPDFAGPHESYNSTFPPEYDEQAYYASQVNAVESHFIESAANVEAAGQDEITEAMREQIMNALRALTGKTQEAYGELGDAVWYNLMALAQNAKTVAELQTVLQAIPEDSRNANPGIGIPDPAVDTPAPVDFPMIPGGDVPPEPETAAVAGEDDILGGGPLVEDQPVGTAPGGGIPGGPGRRSSSAQDDFFAILGVGPDIRVSKTDVDVEEFMREALNSYNPIPGVAPTPQARQPVAPTNLNDRNEQKVQIEQAVQELLNQNPDMSYADATQRASIDLEIANTRAEGARPVIAGADFSSDEQEEFINEPGTARNLHKLRLEGTHYVGSIDVEDSAIF